MRAVAHWETYEEPDRDVAVVKHVERNVHVVFPLTWAKHHGQKDMIARAKERMAEVERKAGGRSLQPGSVLLAFSRHVLVMPRQEQINPDVPRDLLTMGDLL